MNRSSDIHWSIFKAAAMATVLVALFAPVRVVANEQRACLGKTEQSAAISQGQVVTLGMAIRAARGSVRGRGVREVVRARLCREPNGLLVYVLTMLARDGKVTHISVDATSGKVVEAR